MSFWPRSGHSLQSIEYGRMRVGVVQYFLQHSVTVCDGEPSSSETLCHLLCYIHWKKVHPHADWCGISATICTELFETPDVCCFMPAQRIGFRCAYANLPMKFPTHEETVFCMPHSTEVFKIANFLFLITRIYHALFIFHLLFKPH